MGAVFFWQYIMTVKKSCTMHTTNIILSLVWLIFDIIYIYLQRCLQRGQYYILFKFFKEIVTIIWQPRYILYFLFCFNVPEDSSSLLDYSERIFSPFRGLLVLWCLSRSPFNSPLSHYFLWCNGARNTMYVSRIVDLFTAFLDELYYGIWHLCPKSLQQNAYHAGKNVCCEKFQCYLMDCLECCLLDDPKNSSLKQNILKGFKSCKLVLLFIQKGF